MNGDAQCVICYSIIRKQTYYLRKHYYSCHGNYNNLTGGDRSLKLFELKAAFFLKFMVNETNTNDDNSFDETDIHYNSCQLLRENVSLPLKKASYAVALALAKQCRPFEDGFFF